MVSFSYFPVETKDLLSQREQKIGKYPFLFPGNFINFVIRRQKEMSLPDNLHIHRIPFVRLLLPFLAGILTGIHVEKLFFIQAGLFVTGLFLILFAFLVRAPVRRYKREPWGGVGILFLYFVSGMLVAGLTTQNIDQKGMLTGPSFLVGSVLRPASARPKSEKVLIRVEAVKKRGQWLRVPGKAVLYFPKGSSVTGSRPGEVLLVHTVLRPFVYYGNPGEFDYRSYMNDHGFLWQGYVREGQWYRLSGRGRKTPVMVAARLRAAAVEKLREGGLTGRRLAVAAALLAGEREYLDREVRTLFAASGTMHILAISGLHVGIIYLVLVWLFSLAGNYRIIKYISFPLILLALWGYAFLTGLSPSVVRAALMFSLFLTASVFRRQSNPYNTLAVAAFIMLMVQPLLVREAAFQLSFLAVLGIITFYRPLYHLGATGWPLIDRIWALLAVSLSAQITTFPLTLYYFHRFPLLFPVTNILVIPLVTLFIYGGMLFFLFHAIPFAAKSLSFFLDKTAALLLDITSQAGTLPHAVVEPVWIRLSGVFWFYLMILGLTLLFIYRKPVYLIILQILLFTGVMGLLVHYRQDCFTDRVVVFNVPGRTGILLSYGRDGLLLQEESMETGYYTENAIGFYRLKKSVSITKAAWEKDVFSDSISLSPGIMLRSGFFRAGNITGYFLDKKVTSLRRKIPVDCLIFSGRRWWLLQRQLESVTPRMIILDGSVSSFVTRRIRERCPGVRLFYVRQSGPYILEKSHK